MKASTAVISFILQRCSEGTIQSPLTVNCVFWNGLDTVAVKLQGWSKRHLKLGSSGKSQQSRKPSECFSLLRCFQHTHSRGFCIPSHPFSHSGAVQVCSVAHCCSTRCPSVLTTPLPPSMLPWAAVCGRAHLTIKLARPGNNSCSNTWRRK